MPRTSRIGRKALTAVAAASLLTTAVATATASPASGQPTTAQSTKAVAASHGADKLKVSKAQLSRMKTPAQKLAGGLGNAKGRQTVFVQTSGSGAAAVSRRALSKASGTSSARQADAKQAAASRRAAIVETTTHVLAAAKSLDSSAREIYTIKNLVPGVAMTVGASALKALATRSDVVKISKIVPKTASNASAAQLTRVLDTWTVGASGNIGTGITVGVIDTGLDYTHADFGGTGTKQAYKDALRDDTNPNWYNGLPTLAAAKIAGGYDFAGDSYQADPATAGYQPVPHPDGNPLDCTDHGTHVSGTVAGYGVTSAGSTFTDSYHSLSGSDLDGMRIGPGMAPGARLYALRIFGCAGSTDLVGPALDMAADPNGDGNFSDHLDIVNLSLGSDYVPADDPENAEIDALATVGTLPVIAEGNAGDLTDAGGEPGNATRALAVASTVDALQLRDGLQVTAPVSKVEGGQNSVAYDYATKGDVLDKVVVAIPADASNKSGDGNLDGCDPLTMTQAAAVAGKVAWLEWNDDDAARQCGSVARSANVQKAGAAGAIFTSQHNVFGAGITGDVNIPVFQLSKAGTDELRPYLSAGTLKVSFVGSLAGTIKDKDTAIVDTLSSFSSRGSHGALGESINPSVAAPGDTITSAGMGTGNDQLTISGTSMATPHTAGIAALVRSANPQWSVEKVKADIINTAGHDVYSQEGQAGPVYGPDRVGSGRVDALAAVSNTVLAYDEGTIGGVSPSFGVIEVPPGKTVTKTKKIVVENTDTSAQTLGLTYHPIVTEPGVTYAVTPATLTLAAGTSDDATITVTAIGADLRHSIDPTMSADQGGNPRQYLSDASGNVLITPSTTGASARRLPVYAAAKPVSTLTSAAGYDPAGNYGIKSTGAGFHQGTGSTKWSSIASVLQLGSTSPKQKECSDTVLTDCTQNATDEGGDLQYVGANTLPGDHGYTDGTLYFGISTYGDNTGVRTMTPAVDFTVHGHDYEVAATTLPDTDVFVAALYSFDEDAVVDAQPLNFTLGNTDTNVFDSSAFVLPVDLEALTAGDPTLKLTAASVPITYSAGTSSYVGAIQDSTATAKYDIVNPGVVSHAPIYQDAAGVIPVTVSKAVSALVLHLHNASGTRAQKIALAPAASKLTIRAPRVLTYGKSHTVTGVLTDTHTKAGLVPARVSLYGKRAGSKAYTLRTTVRTAAGGRVSATVHPKKNTTYEWRYAGAPNHGPVNSAPALVRVAPVIALSGQPKHVGKNELISLYGTTKPGTAGVLIRLQVKRNGHWVIVAIAKTAKQTLPNGKRVVGYVMTNTEAKNGSYHFRTVWPASAPYGRGVSPTVIVKVGS